MSIIVNSKLHLDKLRFIEMLLDPEDRRTQKEMAAALGYAEETLSRWKRQPDFSNAIFVLAKIAAGADLARVLGMLTRKALSGDVGAARLLLETCGKLGKNIFSKHPAVDEYLEPEPQGHLSARIMVEHVPGHRLKEFCEILKRLDEIFNELSNEVVDECRAEENIRLEIDKKQD